MTLKWKLVRSPAQIEKLALGKKGIYSTEQEGRFSVASNKLGMLLGTLLHCWWECELVKPLWRTVWRFLKKLKIEVPYDPAIPLLGIYLERTLIRKDTCTPAFTAALSKTWKQPKCLLTDEWIRCGVYTHTHSHTPHTHNGILLSHKKE